MSAGAGASSRHDYLRTFKARLGGATKGWPWPATGSGRQLEALKLLPTGFKLLKKKRDALKARFQAGHEATASRPCALLAMHELNLVSSGAAQGHDECR